MRLEIFDRYYMCVGSLLQDSNHKWHLSLVFPTLIGRQRSLRSDSFITSAEPCLRANPGGSRFLKWLPRLPTPQILDLPVFLELQLLAACPGC